MKTSPARLAAGALAALAAVFLAACYPDLDWRPLNSSEGRFGILMPARAHEDSRPVAEGVTMHQWATRAGDALFAVAYTDYPDAALGHVDTVRVALTGKGGGRLADDHAMTQGGLPGRSLTIEFTARGDKAPTVMHVRLLASGYRLYQVAVLGRDAKPVKDDLDMFFDSFHVEQ